MQTHIPWCVAPGMRTHPLTLILEKPPDITTFTLNTGTPCWCVAPAMYTNHDSEQPLVCLMDDMRLHICHRFTTDHSTTRQYMDHNEFNRGIICRCHQLYHQMVIIIAMIQVAITATLLYAGPLYDKTPYHTSALSGRLGV